MNTKLTRRQMLRLAVLGSFGSLLGACAPKLVQSPAEPAAAEPVGDEPVQPSLKLEEVYEEGQTVAVAPTATPSAPVTTATEAASPETLASTIAEAANRFLEALDGDRLAQASYAFNDAERVRWHWTTPRGFPRNGLPLGEMDEAQRTLALALLQASVSEFGYKKSLDIISLQNDLGNDPELYYVTIFGTPGDAEPWGWRFEGHHISRHFTVVDNQVTMTPFFLGAWPTITDAGLRAMPREEDAARELIHSLTGPSYEAALFQAETLTKHVTQNQPQVSPLEPVGVLASELNSDQQKLILEVILTYLGTLPATIAGPIFKRVHEAGLEQIRFGWAGSLEPRQPHYYRLQGPTFLLEFDNSRNRGGHIHSVWRDFEEDFGHHLG